MVADGSLKVIIMQYLQNRRSSAPSRTPKCIVEKLGTEFQKPAQGKQIRRINDLVNFSRRSSEDIRSLWIRYEQVKNSLLLNGIVLPEKLLFARAMAALKLSPRNRAMVMSSLDGRQGEEWAKSPKEATVGIFGFNSEGSGGPILMTNPEEDRHDGIDLGESESNQHSDVWVSKGGKSTRNRPGTNASAVKGAVRNFNGPNGFRAEGKQGRFGKGKFPSANDRRVRCGATDHQWQTCPLPFQPQLAFGRSNGLDSKSSGGEKGAVHGKKILLSGEILPTVEEGMPEGEKVEAVDNETEGYGAEFGEEEYWMGGSVSDAYMTWVCCTYNAQGSNDGKIPPHGRCLGFRIVILGGWAGMVSSVGKQGKSVFITESQAF